MSYRVDTDTHLNIAGDLHWESDQGAPYAEIDESPFAELVACGADQGGSKF